MCSKMAEQSFTVEREAVGHVKDDLTRNVMENLAKIV